MTTFVAVGGVVAGSLPRIRSASEIGPFEAGPEGGIGAALVVRAKHAAAVNASHILE
jgi:hypothetical protein